MSHACNRLGSAPLNSSTLDPYLYSLNVGMDLTFSAAATSCGRAAAACACRHCWLRQLRQHAEHALRQDRAAAAAARLAREHADRAQGP